MSKKNKNKNKITKNIINNFILWSLIIIISKIIESTKSFEKSIWSHK